MNRSMRAAVVALAAALAVMSPRIAQAQAAGPITTPRISTRSAARYFNVSYCATLTTASTSILGRFAYPYAAGARLVDVVAMQYATGTGGTNWTADVRTRTGTSLLTTTVTMTPGAGAGAAVDAKAEIAPVAGGTRPVLKTDATIVVAKGEYIDIVTSESGTYSPHPTVCVTLVFEPKA